MRSAGYNIESSDVRTAAEMMGAGLHVGFADGPGDVQGQAAAGEAVDEVDKEAFCKWVELSEPPLGSALGRWWAYLVPGADGEVDAFKVRGDDSAADFFDQIVADCRGAELQGKEETLTVEALAKWCRRRVGGRLWRGYGWGRGGVGGLHAA